MADDEENGVDPRYDPAFQRGYRGGGTTESARRRAAPEFAGTVVPEPAVKVPAASAAVAGVTETEAATHTNPHDDDRAPRGEALPPLRANPYVYALGVMAALFVLGGIGIEIAMTFSTFSGQSGYQSTPVEWMIMQNIGYVVAGPMITVGLAILAGLVFFAGARRQSMRGGSTP